MGGTAHQDYRLGSPAPCGPGYTGLVPCLGERRNKALQKPKPYSEPKAFGDLCAMDHGFAAHELSRGLCGETACVAFRGRLTDYIACAGVHEKATEHVVHFLTQLKHPRENV